MNNTSKKHSLPLHHTDMNDIVDRVVWQCLESNDGQIAIWFADNSYIVFAAVENRVTEDTFLTQDTKRELNII